MMAVGYSVKGSSIRMKYEFVRDRFGADAEAAMRRHFADRPELRALLDTSWLPFELYDEINRYIALAHFGGVLERLSEVGTYSAERGLTSTYRIWLKGKTFSEFLTRFSQYYPTYYSHGELETEMAPDGFGATVRFRRAPVYTQAELHIAAGYFLGACRVMGLPGGTCAASLSRTGMDLALRWQA